MCFVTAEEGHSQETVLERDACRQILKQNSRLDVLGINMLYAQRPELGVKRGYVAAVRDLRFCR